MKTQLAERTSSLEIKSILIEFLSGQRPRRLNPGNIHINGYFQMPV